MCNCARVLDFVRRYPGRRTIRIAQKLGINKRTAQRHLLRLESEGLAEWDTFAGSTAKHWYLV